MIYVVRCNTGQFYRRGKLVRSEDAASFGWSPSGAKGILERARRTFPELQWEAVPYRDTKAASGVGESRGQPFPPKAPHASEGKE